jgi:transposase
VATPPLPTKVVADPRHNGTAPPRVGNGDPLPLPGRTDPHAVDHDQVNQQPTGTGLWRAGCGGTRTSGSEVRAGETGRRKRRHRAPARPYIFAWLHAFRRLRTRYERRADTHQAMISLACSIICLRNLLTLR